MSRGGLPATDTPIRYCFFLEEVNTYFLFCAIFKKLYYYLFQVTVIISKNYLAI
jgi:hypothetical protein